MLMFADVAFFKITDKASNTDVVVEYDETKISSADDAETMMNKEIMYDLGIIAILALVSLVMFKNRKLQVSLTSFNFVAIILLIALMYYYSFGKDYIEEVKGELSFNALLPLGLLFFNFLALRGIKRDISLIRSMDRFR